MGAVVKEISIRWVADLPIADDLATYIQKRLTDGCNLLASLNGAKDEDGRSALLRQSFGLQEQEVTDERATSLIADLVIAWLPPELRSGLAAIQAASAP